MQPASGKRPAEAVEAFLMKVDSLLDSGYKEYIANLGHYYESDENALLNRIREYKSNYFDGVKDFSIPTTNMNLTFKIKHHKLLSIWQWHRILF